MKMKIYPHLNYETYDQAKRIVEYLKKQIIKILEYQEILHGQVKYSNDELEKYINQINEIKKTFPGVWKMYKRAFSLIEAIIMLFIVSILIIVVITTTKQTITEKFTEIETQIEQYENQLKQYMEE